MTTWLWLLIVLLLAFLAFGQPDVARAPVEPVTILGEPWEPVSVGDVEGVIVAPSDAYLLVDSLGLDDAASWRPTVADVEAAEAALAAEVGALDHMRQYAGYIEDDERKIYINGFCDAHGIDWRERPVMVDGGGDCYFTAIYNVDSGELERMGFNGEA